MRLASFLCCLLLPALSCGDGLSVRHDRGGVPLSRMLGLPTPSPDPPRGPQTVPGRLWDRLFPVRTPELSPGPVAPRRFGDGEKPAAFPFFLVGDDPLSREWLSRHAARLREIRAVGFLVNGESPDRWQEMQRAFGLVLAPVGGSQIAARFSLVHYPVLVSGHGVEQ